MNHENPNGMSDYQAWDACPSGELQSLATRLQTAERSRQRAAVAKVTGMSAAAAAAFVVASGLFFAQPGGGMMPGGIACSDCVASMDGYHLHLTADAEMASPSAEQMAAHLDGCETCHQKFEMMFPGVLDRLALNDVDLDHADVANTF